MKVIVVVYAAFLASVASASPRVDEQRINERFVEGIFAGAIEDLSNQIRENGLDPFYVSEKKNLRLPVTDLVVVKGEVVELLIVGLSNIVLNRVNYSLLTSRLTFELVVPLISADVVSSEVDLTFFGYQASGSVSGRLDIQNIRVSGDIRLSIFGGVSVRSISIDFTLGGIRSDLQVNALGRDLSENINEFAGTTVPNVIAANRDDINRVLEHYIKILIEENL